MLMEEKLCKNCVWYEPSEWDPEFAKCANPATLLTVPSNVTGETRTQIASCWHSRLPLSACGPEAKLYEAKDAE